MGMDYLTYVIGICIGIGLSLPNIILQIVRSCKSQMTSSKSTLTINIICHLVYGITISELFILENNKLYQVLAAAYGIICAICLYKACRGGAKTIFSAIYYLCQNLEDLQSLQTIVSFNRRIPPKIYARATASHEESRQVWKEYEQYTVPVYKKKTVVFNDGSGFSDEEFDHFDIDYRYKTTHYSRWGRVDEGGGRFNGCPGSSSSRYEKSEETKTVITWEKSKVYQYGSWEDRTESFSNIKYYTIVEASFDVDYYVDDESSKILKDYKDELYKEAEGRDTDVVSKIHYTTPSFFDNHTCSLNDEEYKRIKNIFSNCCGYTLWFILFLIGYNSIFETFSRYEIGKEDFTLVKYIAYDNKYRADYNENDSPPSIKFNFVYTKIQEKSIKKKIEKGLLDEDALETPNVTIY